MTGRRAAGGSGLTVGRAVAAGFVAAAVGFDAVGGGDTAGAATGAAGGAGCVTAGAVTGSGVVDCSGGDELTPANFGHTVNTRPAIRITAAALPNIGSRLASDARGGGKLAFGVALTGGGTGRCAAAGRGGCGGAATADGAGAIGGGAPTIVAAIAASRCTGAATGGAAITAASSGVILMRTVSAVALTADFFGRSASRENAPSTMCATFGTVSATAALMASASTATVPRYKESSA